MRIILCGGGTAGHVSPAIAIAEELREETPKSEILFIGRTDGGENRAVVNAGIKLETLAVKGIKRSVSIENVKRMKIAIEARKKAKEIIAEFAPDVVLGTGGYVCWPVISAAKSMNIPVAIHESNITPGLTTRLLSRKCNVVFLNRKDTTSYLSKKTKIRIVGNPVRKELKKTNLEFARRKLGLNNDDFFILSFGGSGGAKKINEIMISIMKEYTSKEKNTRHVHCTGEKYYTTMNKQSKSFNTNGCSIKEYIDDMPTYIKAADLVICRSGAMTLSEICEAGTTAILIPSPNVTGNHQYLNARHLSEKDGAILIEEKNLSKEVVINAIKDIKNDKNGRKKRAKILKELSTPNAAKDIINELELLKNGNK